MSNERFGISPLEAPFSQLERALLDEFVLAQGGDSLKLAALPEKTRERLLKEATVYASARLTEIESRSHLLHEIHDGGASKTGL